MDIKTKAQCLASAVEIGKQAATHITNAALLASIIETTYKKLVELAEDVQGATEQP